MSGISTAAYVARRAAQKERVRILYRHALKDILNWAVHRHIFYRDASDLREKYNANQDVDMAHSLIIISNNLNSLVLNHHHYQWRSFETLVWSPFKSKRRLARNIRALQESEGPTQRRLIDIIRSVPEISRNYFKKPSRRTLFGGISLLGGFYVAHTISLSFGALGVNDVIAAVLCVLLTEYVTRFYYSRTIVTFPIALLNNFKMGFTYGLFIDVFKLAS